PPHPPPTLFPYTTLFRSDRARAPRSLRSRSPPRAPAARDPRAPSRPPSGRSGCHPPRGPSASAVLLGEWCCGRARPALVDLGRGAEQELLEIAVNRLRPVGGAVLELVEDEVPVRFAKRRPVRRHQERRERRLADEPEELGVHDPAVVEDDDAPP